MNQLGLFGDAAPEPSRRRAPARRPAPGMAPAAVVPAPEAPSAAREEPPAAVAAEAPPAPAEPDAGAEAPRSTPRWAVFVATPEGAPEIPPVPVQAPARSQAEQIAAAYAGVSEDRCLAVEGGDWCSELMAVLGEMNRRADEDVHRLKAVHARILGCSVDELDARMAAEKRQQEAERAARRVERPSRGRAAAAPAPRAQRSLDEEPAAPPMRRLDDRQRELLALVAVEGNRALYTRDERVPDWDALKIVIETLGGRWTKGGKKRRGGWEFPEDVDATEVIRLAQESGEILDLRAAGFFPTPTWLAEDLVRLALIPPGATVLEPSAGTGRIAEAVRRLHPDARVLCVELLPANRAELGRLGFEVVGEDFLALSPSDLPPIDACVLNPPFARFADAHHVAHALRCVRPGGTVAAIMGAGARYRDAAPYMELRALIAANDGTMEDVPEGAFIESGTGVRTVKVAMRRAA